LREQRKESDHVPQSTALVDGVAIAPTEEVDDFTLDVSVVEASLPLAKMSCDTSDNCGGTTCGSACTSQVAQNPF
jgi:FxLD family lantipeptide